MVENGLPEGWALGTVPDLIGPAGLFCDGDWVESKDQDPDGDVRLIQLADIGDGFYRDKSRRFLTTGQAEELNCTFLEAGDVLIARMPDPLGRACIFPGDPKVSVTAVDVCIVRCRDSGVDHAWLMGTVNSPDLRRQIETYQRGTTRKRVSRKNLGIIQLPVPPLAEQKRIVAMVEKLLARVNAARERLTKVPAILKRFRQSVLAAACSGRLTADWRDAHPDIEPASGVLRCICEDRGLLAEQVLAPTKGDHERPDGWVNTTLGFLAEPTLRGRPYVTSGSRGWARYVSNRGPFFVRSENINTEYLRLDNAVRVDPPAGAEADRTRVQANDLLLTITGNNVGRTAVVPADCPLAHVSQHVAIIRTSLRCHVPYLWLWVRSEEHGQAQLRSHFYGETKPGLNMDQVKGVWVLFPPLGEQHEIVRRVEALFKLADTIEQRVQTGTHRSDKLTQSILAKAFRGELVPTEAELARREGRDYEPASVLLERIKAEREKAAKIRTARRGRHSERAQ